MPNIICSVSLFPCCHWPANAGRSCCQCRTFLGAGRWRRLFPSSHPTANAAAYSGAGNQVLIKLWKETETTTITIENTGAHIPDEAISRLFEPFYRVDQSRNKQTGGTGLGLYIVKTILDLHGAKIEIANTIQGVIVSVQF